MKTSRGCGLFFAKASLVKLLTHAFAGSQILALWLTFGKQKFSITVSLDRKNIEAPNYFNLI